MNTFDSYTRNVIVNALLKEQADQTAVNSPPPKPKKGQTYKTKDGRTFVWNGSYWQTKTSQSSKQSQGGVGFAGDILPPPITKGKGGEIVPAPPEAILYGLSNVPSGYDPKTQATIYNYYTRLNTALEGMCGGALSAMAARGGSALQRVGQWLNNVMPSGRGSAVGTGLELLGKGASYASDLMTWTQKNPVRAATADYLVKQAIRTAAAKAYLGVPGTKPEKGSAEELFQQEIEDMVPGLSTGTGINFTKGRFGAAGERMSKLIPELAAMGYDPMEYMLKKFGAQEASQSIANSAAKEADLTMSAGGYLRRGRELGAFK